MLMCYNSEMKSKKIILLFISIIYAVSITGCSNISSIEDYPDNTGQRSEIALETIPPTEYEPIAEPEPTSSQIVTQNQSTTSPEPSPSPGPVKFTILATGDVMAHGDNLKSALNPKTGEYSFIENYRLVQPIIAKADLAICNLETVTAGKDTGYTSYPLFNTPAAILDGLKYAGFDVLVTANNHSLDRGETGILKTLEEIHSRGMMTTGTYDTPDKNYLTYDIKGFSISILAYTQQLNGNLPMLDEDRHYMINQMKKETIIQDIHKASEHSDLVLVYLHWGNEYTLGAEEWQPAYAYSLIEAGADVILGTHPHVVRPDEIVMHNGEPKYIIYSMGNFISNFIREDNRQNAIYTEDGVMIKLDFIADDTGNVSLEKAEPIPTWPYKYTNETGIHYEIIPVQNNLSIVHEVSYADFEAKESYKRTMATLKGFNMTD